MAKNASLHIYVLLRSIYNIIIIINEFINTFPALTGHESLLKADCTFYFFLHFVGWMVLYGDLTQVRGCVSKLRTLRQEDGRNLFNP